MSNVDLEDSRTQQAKNRWDEDARGISEGMGMKVSGRGRGASRFCSV